MDVDKLRAERQRLEMGIHFSVSKWVDEFRARTGFSPHSIDIKMVETSTVGDPEPVFTVGPVKVLIDV